MNQIPVGKYIRLLLFSLLFCFAASAQQSASSETELKKQAEKAFLSEKFDEALSPYSQLLSLYPNNSSYNYRYGVALLNAGKNKANAVSYLEVAAKDVLNPQEVWIYLGQAYMVIGKFDDALGCFRKFESIVNSTMLKKFNSEELKANCMNAIELLKTRKNIAIISSKDVARNEFYKYYDWSQANGKLVPAAEQFLTTMDKDNQLNPVMFIANDKQTIYLSSYGKRGERGKDIYVVRKMPNGNWSTPENLGETINSEANEDFPYLDRDGRTLYFASKSKKSIGGYDIFKSKIDFNTGQWSTPENLGWPINTIADDYLYVPILKGSEAFYSTTISSTKTEIELRRIQLPDQGEALVTITGYYAPTDQRVRRDARVTILRAGGEGIITSVYTDPNTGKYEVTLEPGLDYVIVVEGGGYLPHAENFTLPSNLDNSELKQIVKINREKTNENLILENYFYPATAVLEVPSEVKSVSYDTNADSSSMMAIQINNQTVLVTKPGSGKEITTDESIPKSNLVTIEKKDEYDPSLEHTATPDEIRQKKEEEGRAQELANDGKKADNYDVTIGNEELASIAILDAKTSRQEADSLNREVERLKAGAIERDSLSAEMSLKAENATEQEKPSYLNEAYVLKADADNMRRQADDLTIAAMAKDTEAKASEQEANQLLAIINDNKSTKNAKDKSKVTANSPVVQEPTLVQNEVKIDSTLVAKDEIKELSATETPVTSPENSETNNSSQSDATTSSTSENAKDENAKVNSTESTSSVNTETSGNKEVSKASVDKEKKSEPNNNSEDKPLTLQDSNNKVNIDESKNANSVNDSIKIDTQVVENKVQPNVDQKSNEITSDQQDIQNSSIEGKNGASISSENVTEKINNKSENTSAQEVSENVSEDKSVEIKNENSKSDLADNNVSHEMSATEKSSAKSNESVSSEKVSAEDENSEKNETTNSNIESKSVESKPSANSNNSRPTNNSSNVASISQDSTGTNSKDVATSAAVNTESSKSNPPSNSKIEKNSNSSTTENKVEQDETINSKNEVTSSGTVNQNVDEITSDQSPVGASKENEKSSLETSGEISDNSNVPTSDDNVVSSSKDESQKTNSTIEELNTDQKNRDSNSHVAVAPNIIPDNKNSDNPTGENTIDENKTTQDSKGINNANKDLATNTTSDNSSKSESLSNDKSIEKENAASTAELKPPFIVPADEKKPFPANINTLKLNPISEEARIAYQAFRSKYKNAKQLSDQAISLQNRISETKSSPERDSLINVSNSLVDQSAAMYDEALAQLYAAEAIDPDVEHKMEVNEQIIAYNSSMPTGSSEKESPTLNQPTSTETISDNKTIGDSTEQQIASSSSETAGDKVESAPSDNSIVAPSEENAEATTESATESSYELSPEEAKAVDEATTFTVETPNGKEVVKIDTTGIDTRHPEFQKYVEVNKEITAKQVETIDVFADAVNQNKLAVEQKQEQNRLMDKAEVEQDRPTKAQIFIQADAMRDSSKKNEEESAAKFAMAQSKTNEVKSKTSEMQEIRKRIARPGSQLPEQATKSTVSPEGLSQEEILAMTKPEEKVQENSTKNYNRNTSDQSAVNSVPSTTYTPEKVEQFAKKSFSIASAPVYNKENPIPMNPPIPDGLVFKVQIGAFRNEIPAEKFEGVQPITAETTRPSWVRYCVGLFQTFEPAVVVKKEMQQRGFKDAFVVAYLNGKRIGLDQAYAMIGKGKSSPDKSYVQTSQTEMALLRANNIRPENISSIRNNVIDTDEKSFYGENASNVKKSLAAVEYSVQVGVYKTQTTPKGLQTLTPLFTEKIRANLFRFTTDHYMSYASADSMKRIARREGVKDAFIVVYRNGVQSALSSVPIAERTVKSTPDVASVVSAPASTNQSSTTQTSTITKPTTQNSTESKSTQNFPSAITSDGKIIYRVQIGAFKNNIPFTAVVTFLNVADKGITQLTDDRGLHIFYAGTLDNFTAASALREEIVSKGVTDAFVVALQDGKRIVLTDEMKK